MTHEGSRLIVSIIHSTTGAIEVALQTQPVTSLNMIPFHNFIGGVPKSRTYPGKSMAFESKLYTTIDKVVLKGYGRQ